MLSDRDIRRCIESGDIVIAPLDVALIQPASVDVKLDQRFRVFPNSRHPVIEALNPPEDITELVEVDAGQQFILHPGEFVLASTVERVTISNKLAARLEGKSSMGRIGLMIHSTAGFIDPGFNGDITLELSNVAQDTDRAHAWHEDRAAVVPRALVAVRVPLRIPGTGLTLPRPAGAHRVQNHKAFDTRLSVQHG